MTTYYRDFGNVSLAANFAKERSHLGHNVKSVPRDKSIRVYFSASPLDPSNAVIAAPPAPPSRRPPAKR